MPPVSEIVRYADAGLLIAFAAEAMNPVAQISVAEHAAQHRWLANSGGGYVGRWRHEEAPYLVGPMEALTAPEHLTVAIVGPGQCGKTAVGENWLYTSALHDPANMLWYMQTDEGVAAYVKGRINPIIDQHEDLARRQGIRPVDDSLHFKRFRGMNVEFLSATHSNLINKSAPRILADEVDAYAAILGDVKVLLDTRRQVYGRASMVLAISHPDLARGVHPEWGDWAEGIMAIYADSDRRVWYWPCPICGAWSSPAPTAARVMTLDYPAGPDIPLDDVAAAARLVCPINGCLIEDHHRRAMNIAAWRSPFGGWLGEGQTIAEDGTVSGARVNRDTAGFWIVGVMSNFILGGLGGLARARAKAERDFEATGEDKTLRNVVVKQFGFPYARPKKAGSIDATALVERAEPGLALGVVPTAARFLTLAVDCQIAHFEWLLRAWGEKGESWVATTGRIPADPATSADDWDKLLELFERRWPIGDGSGREMAVRGAGIDSAGAPGVTAQAYDAWMRWRRAKRTRFFGRVGGRDVWSVILLKGSSGFNAPRLQVSYPDTTRKANVKAGGGAVPVASFNPNLFKDDLAGQLAVAEPGPWHVHLPAALKSKEPPHVWFEQLAAEEQKRNGRWEKKANAARNEALDLMVMTHAVAHLHGVRRVDWKNPPAWAAPFDLNALVFAAGAAVPAPAETPPSSGDPASAAPPDSPPAQAPARKTSPLPRFIRSPFVGR